MQAPIVLVVDDEILIAQLLETCLSEEGFDVRVAKDAATALVSIEDIGDGLAALITDVHLGPGQNGWVVASIARTQVPTLPVVFMTADGADEYAAHGVPGSILISKPFVTAQIVTAVTSLMNGPPAM